MTTPWYRGGDILVAYDTTSTPYSFTRLYPAIWFSQLNASLHNTFTNTKIFGGLTCFTLNKRILH